MAHSIASDAHHGSYCPTTQGRERLAREDERTSLELARRLNLKSWRDRGNAADPSVCLCGCGLSVPKTQRSGYATLRCRRKMDARAARRRAGA
jgi:hypothetical protein